MLSLVELRLRKLHFNSDSRRTPSLMGSLPHHYLFAGLNKGEQIQKVMGGQRLDYLHVLSQTKVAAQSSHYDTCK